MTQPYTTAVVSTAGSQAVAYNPDGTVSSITKVFPGDVVFIKTFTYVDLRVTNITDWVLQ